LLRRVLARRSDGDDDGKDSGSRRKGPLYGSVTIPPGASSKGISDGDLAVQTRMANKKYSIMELIELSGDRDIDRASAALLSLFVGSSLSAVVANQKLPGPEIVRFAVVWILSFLPFAFVGYGLNDIENVQAVLVSVQRNVFPVYRKRLIQHEAGHFLMGHLLGYPVRDYTTNSVKNAVELFPFADADSGSDYSRRLGFDVGARRAAEEETTAAKAGPPRDPDAPFFGPDGRGADIVERQSVFRREAAEKENDYSTFLKLPSDNEPSKAWPYRGFDDGAIDALSAISVAGVCAEILAFGNAEGGVADFGQLRQIFNSAEEELSDRDCDNRIRFALAFAMTQLRRHLGALDALADAMERGGSVEECIVAIETCDNQSGQDGILGDYEQRRKEMFRADGSWVERLFLGTGKSADDEEDRFVEGKGGGGLREKKKLIQLTGDDPLYAALAVSFVFLVWASSGGLSLH